MLFNGTPKKELQHNLCGSSLNWGCLPPKIAVFLVDVSPWNTADKVLCPRSMSQNQSHRCPCQTVEHHIDSFSVSYRFVFLRYPLFVVALKEHSAVQTTRPPPPSENMARSHTYFSCTHKGCRNLVLLAHAILQGGVGCLLQFSETPLVPTVANWAKRVTTPDDPLLDDPQWPL